LSEAIPGRRRELRAGRCVAVLVLAGILLTAGGCGRLARWLPSKPPAPEPQPVEESELHALPIAPSVGYANTLDLGEGRRIYYSDRDVLYADGEHFYPIVVQGYPRLLGASPKQTAVAFLEPAEFEMAADLFVFDLPALTLRRLTDHRDPASTLSVKTALWYNEKTLYYLEGYRYGTVSHGGDLWRVELDSLARKPVVRVIGKSDEFEEIIEFEFVPGHKLIRYTVAHYDDFGRPIRRSSYCTLEGKRVE
jgi:hypothetical protein